MANGGMAIENQELKKGLDGGGGSRNKVGQLNKVGSQK